MPVVDLILMGTIFLLIIVQGFYAGAETAFTSVDRIAVFRLAAAGDRRAGCTQRLIDKIEQVIGTTLVGTNLAIVTSTTLAESLIHRHAPAELQSILNAIIMTPLMVVFGEMLPKSLGRAFAMPFSLLAADTVALSERIFLPVNAVTGRISNILASYFDTKDKPHPTRVTRDDLRAMAELAVEQGLLPDSSGPMFSTVFQLDSRPVASVMVPIHDVRSLPATATVADVERLALQSGFARFPVYEDRQDEIIGIVEVPSLLFAQVQAPAGTSSPLRPDDSITPLLQRNVIYIPETKSVGALLHDLRYQRIPMAMVVDEHGTIVGMVTMDDLVEEVVGNLSGENQEPDRPVKAAGTFVFECAGQLQIRRLGEHLGVEIAHEGFDTVAGLVLKLAGRIPAAGERFVFDRYDVEVLAVKGRRIEKLRFTRQPHSSRNR